MFSNGEKAIPKYQFDTLELEFGTLGLYLALWGFIWHFGALFGTLEFQIGTLEMLSFIKYYLRL